MLQYALKRIFWFIPILLGVATVTFFILYVLPGDPVLSMVGERYDAATIQNLRAQMHLDDPLPQRYLRYLSDLVHLDLGRSYVTGVPVWDSIKERAPHTFRLALAAMTIAVLIGMSIGVLAAWKRGSPLDYVLVGGAVIGVSMPVFWLGVLLIYVFSARLGLLPASGFGDGRLAYLVLPAITLSQASTAYVARITRSSVLDEVGENYIKAARAKGLSEPRLLVRHALRNALLPIITVVGIDFGSYLSGAVLTESIFAWPGLGRFTLDAILKRDLPAIQGSVLFMAAAFMAVNLAVDLLYARVDPRVKLGGRRRIVNTAHATTTVEVLRERTRPPLWRRLVAHPGGLVGAILVMIVVVAGLFAPLLSPYDPNAIDMDHALQAPALAHPFGTDAFGRDVATRAMYGARFSLEVGVVSRVIALAIGTLLGLLAGYYGGRTERWIMRLADVTLAYPGLLLLIAVMAAVGPSKLSLFVSIGVVGWAGVARLVRAQVLTIKEREYVLAIRSIGASDATVIWRHILPNVLTPVIVIFSIGLGASIMAESSLSFLGLGAQPPTASWGSMISSGIDYVRVAAWLSLAPGIVVTLTVLGFNLLGDALRDMSDPRLGRPTRR